MGDSDLLLRLECSLFFQQNPYTLETEEGVALRLGRISKELRPALEYLVGHGILDKIGEGESAIYRYLQPLVQEESDVL
ncbi:hypothetical protein SD70_10210 [Gordoniibacillus kamchatkensis]|uniref:Uncharacterized protein n=1 Tax=Gordoniibacillus kamchatkensis TaxID=1590651 RepID=A0ABR5AJ63_9BACL|nr:hypothetical protein [Paenibacillus sp. VKM B-2647]KIL40985.1 hypothetical protein SD70_10210 [Paenibacillus sp. VKM B-2647]